MRRGFTLVEILIVIAIVVILIIAMIGTLNPIALVERGNDGKRKRDVNRIRIALEDYYNNKRCYPTKLEIDQLMQKSNCGKNMTAIFSSFGPWVCDPSARLPYPIAVPDVSCPKQFKIMAKLYNTKDSNIPANWYLTKNKYLGFVGSLIPADTVNYGVSDGSAPWYEIVDTCAIFLKKNPGLGYGCFVKSGSCNSAGTGRCEGDSCYLDSNCTLDCKVPACNAY